MKITLDVQQIDLPGLPIAYADQHERAVVSATLGGTLCHFSVDVAAMDRALKQVAADPETSINFNITNRN